MKSIRILDVVYHDHLVGKLVLNKQNEILFQYDPSWIRNGFPLNPLTLPLQSDVFPPAKFEPFDGLFGVFADSLPDGWGALLTDRMLRDHGVDPSTLSPLDRLAIVGSKGRGALEYRPELFGDHEISISSLEKLAEESRRLFDDQNVDDINEIFGLAGSSGGARPKANIQVDDSEWIIKFPCSMDPENIGQMEFDYMKCAEECRLNVPEYRLSEGKFFGVRRFDRDKGKKIHMVSVSGLLETSHRIPNLDYLTLMKLTMILTNSTAEAWKLFDLMCFNVFSHNRDDHSKNFSFLYLDGHWILSPAYDLTYSNSIGGEHATMISGKGKDPDLKDMLAVAKIADLNLKEAEHRLKRIQHTVNSLLRIYLDLRN